MSYDPRSYERNFAIADKSLKNSGLQRGLNPWPRVTGRCELSNVCHSGYQRSYGVVLGRFGLYVLVLLWSDALVLDKTKL